MNRWTLAPLVAFAATAAHAAPPLTALVTTDRTQYGAGRAVEIRLALRNDGDFAQTIQYGSTFEYDVIVRDRSNRIVWQWSANKRPSRELTRFQIAPYSSRKTREIWDRRDLEGRKVADGTYSIEARLFPLKPVFTQVYLGSGSESGGPARDREDRDGGGFDRFPRDPRWGDDGRDDRGGRGDRSDRGNDGPIGSPLERGFFAQLKADRKSVQVGDTVDLTYTISNQSDYSVTYEFNTMQLYEVEAILNGRCVWRLSDSRAYGQRLTLLDLPAGTRKQFKVSFPIARGTKPGDYTLRAYLRANHYEPGTAGEATTRLRID